MCVFACGYNDVNSAVLLNVGLFFYHFQPDPGALPQPV